MNRIRERPNIVERDRNECPIQENRYLTPLNNLCEGIHEQDISRFPVSLIQRDSVDRENDIRDQEQDEGLVQVERRNSMTHKL